MPVDLIPTYNSYLTGIFSIKNKIKKSLVYSKRLRRVHAVSEFSFD